GAVTMINPHAMKHLLPLSGSRGSANLFTMFEQRAPELRNLFEGFAADHGTVCEGHRIAVDMDAGRDGKDPKVLSCTMVKLGVDRAIATFADVTIQVGQERRLKQAETWFASLINGVNDYAVLTITPQGIVDTVNAAFTRQIGRAYDEVTGRSLGEILSADPASGALSLAGQLELAERDGWYVDQSWQERSDGERYWCQRLFAARTGADDGALIGYSVVLRDVARDAFDTNDLRRLLTCDYLTGAANRTHFLQVFRRELKRWEDDRQSLSLVLLDVDHFKAVNDAHGHPVGDQVLIQLTKVASAVLRPSDLFARFGGEEFAVLLPGTPLDEAVSIADRLREAVAAMDVETDQGTVRITASFGCTAAEGAGVTVERLIKSADDQLYAAKHAGRNRVCSGLNLSAAA
ncbi:MAG: GGDEF domain-containing protein, partial [Janthinobacterium lividum]